MKIATGDYMLEIDEDGIGATCRRTGERSEITGTDGVADLLGFEVAADGQPIRFLDPPAISEALSDPSTAALLAQLLEQSRVRHSWRRG